MESVTCQPILEEFEKKLRLKFAYPSDRAQAAANEIRQLSRIVAIPMLLATFYPIRTIIKSLNVRWSAPRATSSREIAAIFCRSEAIRVFRLCPQVIF